MEAANLTYSHQKSSQGGIEILPHCFEPSGKDIICGRARENFYHDGNRYFRDLIQQNVGPYLAAQTKTEKSEAIATMVDQVRVNSPLGGFIKKDSASRRWYRIKDCEARDKVGHAIRKAVQRLEDTKPKLAARLKKECSSRQISRTYSVAKASESAQDVSLLDKQAQSNDEQGLTNIVKLDIERMLQSINGARLPAMNGLSIPLVEKGRGHSSKISSNFIEQLLARRSTQRVLGATPPIGSGEVRLPSLSTVFSGNSLRVLQSPTNLVAMNSAHLVATRLLAQQTRLQAPPLVHSYGGLLGLSASFSHPATSVGELLATLEEKRAKELDYACRLAMSTLQYLAQQHIPVSSRAPPTSETKDGSSRNAASR